MPTTAAIADPGVKINYRIPSIDVLRGLVMVIMALDHTREFFHQYANTDDPLNLQTTTPLLFFTRWITHFCAPVFVFLSGTSAYLQGMRKSTKALSSFLIKRGLWLILLEIIFMSFVFTLDPSYSLITLSILWAIGISMIILGVMIKFSWKTILVTGLIIVCGHNLLDIPEARSGGNVPLILTILHRPAILPVSGSLALGNFYNFIPWTGVMMLGYCFGKVYDINLIEKRNNQIILTGLVLLLLFVAVRFINVYGDPRPWSMQKSGLYTFLSFINTTKYPPSFLFLCMTIGPALLFLAAIATKNNRVNAVLSVYGNVPLFYFLVHFFILRVGSVAFFLSRGHSFHEGFKGVPNFPFKFLVPGEGYSLGAVYIIWLTVVVLLYPACKWFARYKQAHKTWWLSYL